MNMSKGINDPNKLPEDERDFQSQIRPKDFSEFVGPSKVKENLKIFIESSKRLKEPFYRSAGIGKNNSCKYNFK